MKFKMTNKRVLTSPLIKSSLVLIDGGEFDDGLFRIVVPEDTTPEVIKALDDAAREVGAMLARRAWVADLVGYTTNNESEDKR